MVDVELSLVSEKSEGVVERFRNDTNDETNNGTSKTNDDTEEMLSEGNGSASEGLSTEEDERVLNNETEGDDEEEVVVTEDILEGIEDVSTEISAIEFVEELEQDKGLEEDGHVDGTFVVEFVDVHVLHFRNTEDIISIQKDEGEDNNLVNALEDDVTFHVSSNQIFVSLVGLSSQ